MSQGDQFFESMAEAIVQRIQQKLAVKKRVLGLDEAAEYIGLTRKALQQKAARSEIRSVGFDRLLRFDVIDLDRYIESSKRKDSAA